MLISDLKKPCTECEGSGYIAGLDEWGTIQINLRQSCHVCSGRGYNLTELGQDLWKLYKPTNIICTTKDPKKRKTIFDIIPKNFPRLITIGRLDYMSEGLILLTNNGDFARKLELPSSNIPRVYRVCVNSDIKPDQLSLQVTLKNVSFLDL